MTSGGTLPGTPTGTASTVTVHATSHADPGDSDDDTFQVVAALPADLALSVVSDVGAVLMSGQIHYTLRAANNGPNPASSAVLTDVLPAEVAFVSATPSQGHCEALTGTVTYGLGTLAAGGQVTVALAVTVVSTDDVNEIVNRAWVMATGRAEYDPDLENNGKSDIVRSGARSAAGRWCVWSLR